MGQSQNVFATYVAQHLDCKVYRTSHEDDDLKGWLTEHVPGNHELKDTNVEVYFKRRARQTSKLYVTFNESSTIFRLLRCIETEWWEVNET